MFKTTCLDTNIIGVGAYVDCTGTVTANTGAKMTNMTCRMARLDRANHNNGNDVDRQNLEDHCPHAAENATDCSDEVLNPAAVSEPNAAYSVSTFSFAALVLALIAASVQL
jgi:hypothetical protein